MGRFFSKFRWIFEKIEINYLYFSILFFVITALTLSHFLSIQSPLMGVPLFFLLYAMGQAFFEICSFVLVAYLLNRWAPRWAYSLFIALSFALLLVHFTDFTLIRLMDASISYLFKFLFGCGPDHMLAAWQALNMNRAMIAAIIASLSLIPLTGIAIYRLTHRLAHKKPLKISLKQIGIAMGAIGFSLFILDLFVSPSINRLAYDKYQKTLPFGTTFLSPPQRRLQLPSPLALPRNEPVLLPPLTAPSRPNIYLFVIETLRKDFVDSQTAPHLTAFAANNIHFPLSFANASSTHLSWFAIFHSFFPYHWTAVRDQWEKGSLPLRLLKQLGYKIRVYSSADLCYFNMDEIVFGKNRQLADAIKEFSLNRSIEPWERDALAFEAMKRDLQSSEGRQGNLFLFFLDATHSEYSFPKDFPLKFEPISQQIDYLILTQKDIEPIKNRYRNAISYIDTLLGHFFQTLQGEGLYDEAIIAITGDHGEEFFEEGALFHGTHLNHIQTSVPLFCKFQNNPWPAQTEQATHIDLFPSLLHFLIKENSLAPLFDGQSIFTHPRWPFRIAVLQNGSDPPSEFALEKEKNKIRARFLPPQDIGHQTQVEILDLQPPVEEAFVLEAFTPLLKPSSDLPH